MQTYLKLALFIITILFLALISQPTKVLTQSIFPTATPTPTFTPTATPTPTSTPLPTPTPKPSPIPTSTPTVTPIKITDQQLNSWFTTYSNHYSVERDRLFSIAFCESKLNPNARSGDYGGLFQFASQTWQTTRRTMNLDPNPELRFNPEEAIKTAAFKISAGGLSHWKNCVK